MKSAAKKSFLAVAAASLVIAIGAPAMAYADYLGFSDLDATHWAVKDGVVDWATENKVVNGAGGRWMPDATITRAETAMIIWNAAGNPKPDGPATFSDAAYLSWSSDAAAWCQQEGIFTGDGVTGAFDPWNPLTREQAAKVLMVREGGHEGAASVLAGFPDSGSVSGWARGCMAWAVENGVIKGAATESGRVLQPSRGCTRAEFTAMLMNLDENADQGGTGSGGNAGGGTTDQGGSGDGATTPDPKPDPEPTPDPEPETPAADPYDIGNGEWVLDGDNGTSTGLDGGYSREYLVDGKLYGHEPTFGLITNKTTGESLHCIGHRYSEDVADFKVVKTYDMEAQTIHVKATGINRYHGTLEIDLKFKQGSFVYTAAWCCPECNMPVNFYQPEGDESRPVLEAYLCSDKSHSGEGSHDCSLVCGKTYPGGLGHTLATKDQALAAGAYCSNPNCTMYGKKLEDLQSNPHQYDPNDPNMRGRLFFEHYEEQNKL